MAELGVALLTFAPARTQDFVSLGRCAEEEGYAACYTTESLTDTLSIDLAILLGTSRIRVGSFVAVSYLRHPVIAAQMATTASDLSGGRFVLGVGLGHKVRLEALGVPVGEAVGRPARPTSGTSRRCWPAAGSERYPDLPPQSYQGRLLDFRTPEHPVPVYTAAVGAEMAEAGATVSDGVMVWLVPHAGIGELLAAAAARPASGPAGRRLRSRRPCTPSSATTSTRHASPRRPSLSYWVGLPAYNRALARAGYEDGGGRASPRPSRPATPRRCGPPISDRLIDEYCLVGPPRPLPRAAGRLGRDRRGDGRAGAAPGAAGGDLRGGRGAQPAGPVAVVTDHRRAWCTARCRASASNPKSNSGSRQTE